MSFVYVGSRTTRERKARGDGISVYRFDAERGELAPVQVVGDLVNPSYLALNRGGDRLYTVHGDGHEVSTFAVDRHTGHLQRLQTQDCGGSNPVHLALAPDGRHLLVSNHRSGTLAVLPVQDDGLLAPVSQRVALQGTPGPHRQEQPGAKPHFNPFDPGGQWVVVPDKGLDRVFSFRFAAGQLQPAPVPHVDTREGAGPRHLAFHPGAPWAYAVNELDSTVTAYRFDAASGALAPLQILSTLPDDFCGNSRAAGIVVDAAGRRLYASNRGHDSIAVFAIDPASGRLRFLAAQAALGRTPRFFTPTPDGRFLFALNEDSDTIQAFAVDATSGLLSPTGWSAACGSPVCMVFSRGSTE
ncbi:lactonase family protein [Pseudorhodoferax sp.]|uniref:lactonase family protein n=1 Tax=Pseudorhodoferax sp. TaxID=1993553 RepID=UPI002DD69FE6|nr:lactonase family protein [Pseudorhodoferax sp.]